jgi:hypothetical protein
MTGRLRTAIGCALGLALVIGPVAIGSAKPKPKGTTIEGCTQEDLEKPGARQCLDRGTLEGSEMYVVCAPDGSQKCCVNTGADRACYDIAARPAAPPSSTPRLPTQPRKAP